MSWLKKLLPGVGNNPTTASRIPTGLWVRCKECQKTLYGQELEDAQQVCSNCGFHMPIAARARLKHFLDPESGNDIASDLETQDKLKFRDLKRYRDRLSDAKRLTSENEAMIVQHGKLNGKALVTSVFDFRFMGGSMGAIVGEKFSRGCEYALEHRLPHVCFTASGGARMQEGLFSLMQMAKTSAMVQQMRQARLPYLVVLTHPTYGGVTASLAMLGDVIIAEPKASIGFAGRRVIEQTVGETLPEGFQTTEFIYSKGAIDMIAKRTALREQISCLLQHLHRY